MKIYENKSYAKTNRTVVTSCVTVDKRHYITLEDTIFFPEEGGQYADTGWIWPMMKNSDNSGVRLLDGQIANGEIRYQVECEIPTGTEVLCELDWEPRFMRMQQHTGEHILTGVIHNRFGYNNVGFHLSDDAPVTLDLDGTLTAEQIAEMELLANEVVYANLPVTASYPTKEELPSLTYRSKIEIEGQVRLITVGDIEDPVDVCACCAPHVAHTGEVGLIKVLSFQNYKGGTRLHILCGKRAFLYLQEQTRIMNQLSQTFSTSMDKVTNCVNNNLSELSDLKYTVAQLRQKELEMRILALPEGRHACLFADADISGVTAKNCYNMLTARYEGYVGLFMGDDENGYRFQAGSASLDSRELMNLMKEKLGARGGGSKEMVQGKTSAGHDEIEELFEKM